MLNNITKNDLYDYTNRFIFQDEEAFKFSLDSILLAEYVKLKKNSVILDMCTGNAPIPLILSTKTRDKIIGFEIQKDIYTLALKSVRVNNLENQITVINDDVKNIEKIFSGKYFDIITCNPPFFVYNKSAKERNTTEIKTLARHEVTITLEEIMQIVSKVLKDNGTFYLVHRLNRLDDIIIYAEANKLKVKEMQIICTKENDPKIVLLKIQKHSNRGIKIRKIINVNNLTTYQHLFREE